MKRQEHLDGVPAASLAQVVEDFESEGATVTTVETSPGTFTVTADWPDVASTSTRLAAVRSATSDAGRTGGTAPARAATVPPVPDHLVKVGEPDEALVRSIQQALAARGLGPFTSGVFDAAMKSIVMTFQAQQVDPNGTPLVVDGKVGRFTWGSLFGAIPTPPAAAPSALMLQALGIAASQVGQMEVPIGSNRGPMVDEYLRTTGIDPSTTTSDERAWCMCFVYFSFVTAAKALGLANPLPKTAGCVDHWSRAKTIAGARRIKAADAFTEPNLVKPGQIFILDFGGGHGHTGIVESLSGGTMTTIEGNTNAEGSSQGVGVFRLRRRKLNDEFLKGLVDYTGA